MPVSKSAKKITKTRVKRATAKRAATTKRATASKRAKGPTKASKPKAAGRAASKRTVRAKATKPAARRKAPSRKPFVIDFHAHIVVPEVLAFSYENSMFAKAVAERGHGGQAASLQDEFQKPMLDLDLRLRDMDAMGVDMQVISPSILQQCTYFAAPEEALTMERLGNERVAEVVAQKPDRLVGLGSVPMQDAEIAAGELDRCMTELGLKGVIISSNINGKELGDEALRPFWAKAEALGATIFIHPAGSPDPRLRKHRQVITLGQPLEEAFAMSSLVYDGVMDAYPKLKIVMAHGGGFLPFYAGRHDNDYRQGRGGHGLKGELSTYLPKFYVDTVLFNPDMLEFLLTKIPASHILCASDYPFAEKRPVDFVRNAKISAKDQEAILGANTAKLLGLSL
jgi:aminocarboxymuconate-semialdehyde decarboxylase